MRRLLSGGKYQSRDRVRRVVHTRMLSNLRQCQQKASGMHTTSDAKDTVPQFWQTSMSAAAKMQALQSNQVK